jgi:hypothetical protein
MNRLIANLMLAAGLLLHIPVVLTRSNASRGKAPALPDGGISFAFYGAVDEPGEVRTVRAALRAGQQLFVQLLVPRRSPEQDLAEDELPLLTVVSPSNQERVLRASGRETFDEPHTRTSYLICLTERFPAEEGTYTLSVSGSAPARFVLAVGDDERPGEVLGVPIGSVEDVLHWYRAEPSAIR